LQKYFNEEEINKIISQQEKIIVLENELMTVIEEQKRQDFVAEIEELRI
jgi:hypothetical protein